MGLFLVIGTILSALTGAYAAYSQGQAQKRSAEQQSAIAENQAKWAEYNAAQEAQIAAEQARIADYSAQMAEDEAALEAGRQRKEGLRLLAAQRARYGAAGVTLAGTPLLVMEETGADYELDALLTEYQGKVEAWNYRNQARLYESRGSAATIEGAREADVLRTEAALNRTKGAEAGRAGVFNAGSTLLTGALQTGYAWDRYKNPSKYASYGVK